MERDIPDGRSGKAIALIIIFYFIYLKMNRKLLNIKNESRLKALHKLRYSQRCE